MAKVFLGLGSNIDATRHIRDALSDLRIYFGGVQLSPVYESEAVGFAGDNFLNMVVVIDTNMDIGALHKALRDIENKHGRDRRTPKFSGRTLDIDILMYDSCVGDFSGVTLPRDEILKNAFVLKPLCDLAPDLMHPQKNKTIAQLWLEYDKSAQKLWQVNSVATGA